MDEALKIITRIAGLAPSHLRVYETLLMEGPMTAKELSNKAVIPYSKIYSILKRLEKEGLIRRSEGRPALYIPEEPRIVFDKLKERIDAFIDRAEREITTLQRLYEMRKRTRPREYGIKLIIGLRDVLEEFLRITCEARKEALIALPPLSEDSRRKLLETLIRRVPEEVRVRMLIRKEEIDDIVSLRHSMKGMIEIRVKDKMFGGGSVSDMDEVVIVIKCNDGRYLAIESSNEYLVDIARTYYGFLWSEAKPIIV
ncbi:MAG: hypothetical protein DRN15_00310 [Thermoprotei archaeon]|nr:MAG: hypothetical protein DRM97_02425 [Thermoprotei archaeon]RLF25137.1 MAG: hypothetical protein DRN15_00310 [Thermoprotei archaeon]